MRSVTAALALTLIVAACGRDGDAPAPDPAIPAAMIATPAPAATPPASAAEAQAALAPACAAAALNPAICACVSGRVTAAAGTRGLSYVAAAFGDDPAAAAPLEAAMTQDERNDAAEAWLDGQYECLLATDPGLAQPAALAATIPESPFEAMVSACIDAGGAEDACLCRADITADALGEAGLRLAVADAQADPGAVAALAGAQAEGWTDRARATLDQAARQCS